MKLIVATYFPVYYEEFCKITWYTIIFCVLILQTLFDGLRLCCLLHENTDKPFTQDFFFTLTALRRTSLGSLDLKLNINKWLLVWQEVA